MDETLGRIEHTVLGPETTPADVEAVMEAAMTHGMRACVPPCYVAEAAAYAPEVPLTTVVAFPHGQTDSAIASAEAEAAWAAGADEVDLVANVGLLKGEDLDRLETGLEEVVASVPIPVKVIVQAPRLDEADLHRVADVVASSGADFLKTATGYGPGGATEADVALLAEYLPVKASGGIGTWAEAAAMFEAGADRIGTSSGAAIAAEYEAQGDEDDGSGEADGGDEANERDEVDGGGEEAEDADDADAGGNAEGPNQTTLSEQAALDKGDSVGDEDPA
jgi:deoxyribose-phosphate aldolase